MGIFGPSGIGFVAGIIAKLIHPGPNEPLGFILTTRSRYRGCLPGDVCRAGALRVGTRADEGAGIIGAIVGAIIVLVIWGMVVPRDRSST